MVAEAQKYRAQFFQIVGFSLFTPFGKMMMDIFDLKFEKLSMIFFIFLSISAIIGFVGIILITKGLEVLELND